MLELVERHDVRGTIANDPYAGLATLHADTRLIVVNAGDPFGPLPAGDPPSPPDDRLIEQADARLQSALAAGVGLLVVHTGLASLRDVPSYRRAVGGEWRRGHSWHPPFSSADVRITESAHPVAAGLADFSLDDELYTDLDVDTEVDVIATHSLDGVAHPLVWCRTLGASRVVVDALGHDERSYASPGHRAVLDAAVAWLLDAR